MKIIWSSPNLFSRHPRIRNHCFDFPLLDVMEASFKKNNTRATQQLAWKRSDVLMGAWGLVRLSSLRAQRAAAGCAACRGRAEGPLPNAAPLIHLNADLEKLPFMGCDEVWIQSPSSLGSCHFLRRDCQLSQTTSTGPAEGWGDWQGPLGKADIKRPCKLISVMGLSLAIMIFFFLAAVTPGWYRFSDITRAA